MQVQKIQNNNNYCKPNFNGYLVKTRELYKTLEAANAEDILHLRNLMNKMNYRNDGMLFELEETLCLGLHIINYNTNTGKKYITRFQRGNDMTPPYTNKTLKKLIKYLEEKFYGVFNEYDHIRLVNKTFNHELLVTLDEGRV